MAGSCLQMDDAQYADWVGLLQHRAGLHIAPERRSFLVSGVRMRMRETHCGSEREYYDRLVCSGSEDHEWALLIDRLTVHETCFFRHQASLNLAAEQLIPEMREYDRRYTVWSVGCATGEEAYSLAMLLDSSVPDMDGARPWRVIGTDISLPSLQRAREGIYLNRRLRDVPAAFRSIYCEEASASHFRIVDALRERVSWFRWSLLDSAAAPLDGVDLIFCQNVLIYYDRRQRAGIVDQLVDCLRPGGVLVLGPGELTGWKNPKMDKVRYPDTLAYRRMQ